MKPQSVEASTLVAGELLQIPGSKATLEVVGTGGTYIELRDTAGESSFLNRNRFVYLVKERTPDALTPAPVTTPAQLSRHSTMTTHIVRRSLISLDPRLSSVPMMSDVAARFLGMVKPEHKKAGQEMANEQDALWQSLDREGIIESIKAYREGRKWIMADGRHRLEWADARGVVKLPLVEITKAQATAIIEATVMGRRHWTKGQRAYLGVKLHPQVCQASEGRPKNTDSVGVNNATELAKRLGISQDIVLQACKLYVTFYAPGSKPNSPEAIEAASLKDQYEMSIWAGNGLGAVLAGIEGGKATGDKPKAASGFHGLDKPLGTFSRFSALYTTWTPEERTNAQRLMTVKFKDMSPDFRLAVSEALAAAEVSPAA